MKESFHKFEQGGHYILLDICTGGVHVVDKLIYQILNYFEPPLNTECLSELIEKFNDYPENDVKDCYAELCEIVENGGLFGSDDYIDYADANVDAPVKAVCLHVSHDCNLRCGYCFAEGGDFGGERLIMTPETGKAAVDFLIANSKERQDLEMDFFGGEPLLAWNTVVETVEYAKEQAKKYNKSFKFTITTNGLCLDDDKIDYINNEMSNVVLSLDGRKEVNDRLRITPNGSGSYDIILPKFKKLVEHRTKEGFTDYFVRGTFTSYNLDFSKDVLLLANEGFSNISVEPVAVSPEMPFALKAEHLERIKDEYNTLYEIMRDKKRKWNFFHFFIDLNQGPCVLKRLRGCGAGNDYVAISPDGNIFPCHRFVGIDRWKMGNIINSNSLNPEIKEYFAKTHIYSKEKCPNCWARFYCSGGCNAESYLFKGDVQKPLELSCEIMKKRIECAIALVADNIFDSENISFTK